MSAVFSRTIWSEISGYLTQKVPPKPQQISAPGSSVQFQSGDAVEQLPRLGFHPQFAQARAGIVIGDLAAEAGGNAGHAADIHQEGNQLVRARGQMLRARRATPDHPTAARDSGHGSCRRRSRWAPPHNRTARRRRSPGGRSSGHRRGRRSYRRAGRNRSAPPGPPPCSRPAPAASRRRSPPKDGRDPPGR